MRRTRWREQDGFLREIVWFGLIIGIIAVIVLDGLALFTANQSVKDDALRAARAAAQEYAQTLDTKGAELAAQQALIRENERLTGFEVTTRADGATVFAVTATAHADTYVFDLLRYVGLKKWVNQVTNPSATRSSD